MKLNFLAICLKTLKFSTIIANFSGKILAQFCFFKGISMQILDGKALSKIIEQEVAKDAQKLTQSGITAGLAVILVGEDPASCSYVKMKAAACARVGIYSVEHKMPSSISQSALLETIFRLNENPNIHGILVQLPLPPQIDQRAVLEAISPLKDVDGFCSSNVGYVSQGILETSNSDSMKSSKKITTPPCYAPATPLGVITLLKHYKIPLKGANAVIVGASNIVGKPLSALLLNEFATTTTCHIFTRDLSAHTRNADILCVGVGKQNLITADMVKDGAVVVDIGINRTQNGTLVGDVDFENVAPKCSFITPVPGGVGPMTIASLLQNTIKAAKFAALSKTTN